MEGLGREKEGEVTPASAARAGSFAPVTESRLTFLHHRILSGRVRRRYLGIGGRSGRVSNSLVHLARLDHPSHLALGFGRAILKTNTPNKSPFKVSLQERKFKGQTETGR